MRKGREDEAPSVQHPSTREAPRTNTEYVQTVNVVDEVTNRVVTVAAGTNGVAGFFRLEAVRQ